jgi:TIGR03009 family protein
MRSGIGLVMGLLMIGFTGALFGQAPGAARQQPPAGGPAPAQAQPQVDPQLAAQRLDEILDSWTKLNGAAESVLTRFIATKKYNNVNGQTKYFDGTAKFLKLPGGTFGANIAQYEFDAKGWKANCYEKFVFTGAFLYMFDPAAKELLVQAIQPPAPGQEATDGPMPFSIFLMRKEEAKKRFDLRVSQIDKNYTYVEVRPKFQADRQEFVYARLVVMNQETSIQQNGRVVAPIPKNLLREIYWVEPNKAEIKWDIKQIEMNSAQVTRQDVANPETPPGWKRTNYTPPKPVAQGGPVIGAPTKTTRP